MFLISNWLTTGVGSVQSTRIPSNLWGQLAESKEFREEFSALQLKRGVAFQIRALLKKRGWTQGKLAENAKLTQGVVSRAQDPNYGNLTVNTINRIAAGFDAAFLGLFVPFSVLVKWFQNLSEELGEVESFEAEYRRLLKPKRLERIKRRRAKNAKTVYINTGQSVPQRSGAGERQLSLPLFPSGMSTFQSPRPRDVSERSLVEGALAGLVQNATHKKAQPGGGI